MKLSLIVTRESDEKLCELIEGLKNPPGFGEKVKITRFEDLPGKYGLEWHCGEFCYGGMLVRVVNGMILANRARYLIESVLRDEKISFEEYEEFDISKQKLDSKKLTINEPGTSPNLIYIP